MASQRLQNTLLGLFLLLALLNISNAMYVHVRRLPGSALRLQQAGLVKRSLDLLDGNDFVGMRRRRALDLLDGGDFTGMKKRALDLLDGSGFGGLMRKRALDLLDGSGFGGFQKRSLDALEGSGFAGDMRKKSLDSLEGAGFGSFDKRSSQDRYIQISADELNQLESFKQELRDELRRRRVLAEAQLLLD